MYSSIGYYTFYRSLNLLYEIAQNHSWGCSLNTLPNFYHVGEVERHSTERLNFLNSSSHNHMRITRILKSLGELSYEYLKAPFIRFVLHEAIVTGNLANTLNSCMKYWVETIREESERDSLWLLAESLIQTCKHH